MDTQAKPKPSQRLTRLKRQLKRQRIGYALVAAEAGVRVTHVCNVLAGRDKSQPVLDAIRRLLEKERLRPEEALRDAERRIERAAR